MALSFHSNDNYNNQIETTIVTIDSQRSDCWPFVAFPPEFSVSHFCFMWFLRLFSLFFAISPYFLYISLSRYIFFPPSPNTTSPFLSPFLLLNHLLPFYRLSRSHSTLFSRLIHITVTGTVPATNQSFHGQGNETESLAPNDDILPATISMGNILENDEQIASPLTHDSNQSKKVYTIY